MIDISEVHRDSSVYMVVEATPDHLPLMAIFVESVLLTADLGLADVADVQLAVDEICRQIVVQSSDADRIGCLLATGPIGVTGEITGTLRHGPELRTDCFGWHVVRTVTDFVAVESTGEPDERGVVVRFSKSRSQF